MNFRAEAMRYADRVGVTDMDEMLRIEAGLRHRAFLEAIEPIQKIKARLVLHCMPSSVLILAPGELPRITQLEPTGDTLKALQLCDEMIEAERRRILDTP